MLLADRRTETLGPLLDGAAGRGWSRRRLEEIVERLEEKVQQLADVLSLQLPGGWNYRDLLQRAHEQLADAAAEAAGELVGQASPAMRRRPKASRCWTSSRSWPTRPPGSRHRPAPRRGAGPAPRSADADLGLAEALAAAATACRQSRCPLSLLLVELDHREEVLSRVGSETLRPLAAVGRIGLPRLGPSRSRLPAARPKRGSP